MLGSYGDRDNLIIGFMNSSITDEMIAYVTISASSVIKCAPLYTPLLTPYPSRISLPIPSSRLTDNNRVPSLELFIMELAAKSKVHTPTFLCTLVYLHRLKKKLPDFARGMDCTRHRIFLATLIISSKYLNDASPKNSCWARYTSLFSLAEVNLMERQLLELLNYDLRITVEELYQQLEGLWVRIRHPISGVRSYSGGFNIQTSNVAQKQQILGQPRDTRGIHIVNKRKQNPKLILDAQPPRKRALNTYVEVALKKYRTTTNINHNIKSLVSKANLISLPSIGHLYNQSYCDHFSLLKRIAD